MIKHSVIFSFVVILMASCVRSSRHDVDLLTSDPWRYEKAGFGSGDDGNFDALNPAIGDGDKDDILVFRRDGTGYAQQGVHTKDSFPFIWSFQNNDSTIYFQDQYFKVRTLNKHRLEMYVDQRIGGSSSRYVIVLRR